MRTWQGVVLALVSLTLPGVARGDDPGDVNLTKVLKDLRAPEASVEARREAADKLLRLSSELFNIAGHLAEALSSDEDEIVRYRAARALRDLGPSAERAAVNLITALEKDKSDNVRAEVALSLAGVYYNLREPQFLRDKKQAAAALGAALSDKCQKVRVNAANALGSFGPDAKDVVPALVKALGEKDERRFPLSESGVAIRVDVTAANSLAKIGPAAKDAVPALLDLVRNGRDRYLRVYSVMALGDIGDSDGRVTRGLIAAAESEELLGPAVGALGKMGSGRAKEILPVLLRALKTSKDKENSDAIKAGAIRAIVQLGALSDETVPLIEKILRDPTSGLDTRDAAARALKKPVR